MRLQIPEAQLQVPDVAERSVEAILTRDESSGLNLQAGIGLAAARMSGVRFDDSIEVVQQKVIEMGLGGGSYSGDGKLLEYRPPRIELRIPELRLLEDLLYRAAGSHSFQIGSKFFDQKGFRSDHGRYGFLQAVRVAGAYAWLSPPEAQANFELFNNNPSDPAILQGFEPPAGQRDVSVGTNA